MDKFGVFVINFESVSLMLMLNNPLNPFNQANQGSDFLPNAILSLQLRI